MRIAVKCLNPFPSHHQSPGTCTFVGFFRFAATNCVRDYTLDDISPFVAHVWGSYEACNARSMPALAMLQCRLKHLISIPLEQQQALRNSCVFLVI